MTPEPPPDANSGANSGAAPMRVRIERKCFTQRGGGETPVLQDVAFEMQAEELVVLTGPSGCGKTTLLKLIAGLDHDYRGAVSLPQPHGDQLALSCMFQEPRLLPWRTVRENVQLVLPPALPPAQQRDRIEWLLDGMELSHAADNYPPSLSMGMARRAALARAFAVETPLLIMDEPFSSIDERTAIRLRKLLLSQLQASPRTVLFVTHNLREALFLADRLLLLSQRPATLVADRSLQPARSDGRGRTAAVVERLRAETLEQFPNILG